MTSKSSKLKPEEITNPLRIYSDLKFCEAVRDAINRDPNRRAEVKRDGLLCQVVDYSKPIKMKRHTVDNAPNLIIGWNPMEGYE